MGTSQNRTIRGRHSGIRNIVRSGRFCGSFINNLLMMDQNLEYDFLHAIVGGRLEDVISCINKGATVNEPISYKYDRSFGSKFPIFWAIKYEKPEILKTLLCKGATLQYSHPNGESPLERAVRQNSTQLVYCLLTSGAKAHEKPRHCNEDTILQIAAENGNFEMLRMLVDGGADVNVNSPLLISTLLKKDQQGLLDYLLQNNLNVNKTTDDNSTLLLYAVDNNNLDMVQWLLDNGAKFIIPSALVKAVEENRVKMVELFLKHKLPLNIQWKDGCTILLKSVYTLNLDIVKELVKAGADVNLLSSAGASPLIESIKLNHQDMVAFLLDHGADPNLSDGGGNTPLLTSIQNGNPEVFEKLMECGADINRLNGDEIDNKEVNIDASGECGFTPLTKSVNDDNLEIVKLLIKHGANIDQIDKNGSSPVVLAASRGSFEIYDFLMNSGCNIHRVEEELDEVAQNDFNFSCYLFGVREQRKKDGISGGQTDEKLGTK